MTTTQYPRDLSPDAGQPVKLVDKIEEARKAVAEGQRELPALVDGKPNGPLWRLYAKHFAQPMAHKSMTEQGRTYNYVTARQVAERLDTVVGPGNWSTQFRLVDVMTIECTLTIFGVSKADIGYPNAETERQRELETEPLKSAYSDAFKRAAVMWGIGRYLYGE